MKAMTEATGKEMILDKAYQEIAPFYLENGTYLVNGLVSGLHQDVLTIMEETLNFTTLLYKRKDRVWGFANVQAGTYITLLKRFHLVFESFAFFIVRWFTRGWWYHGRRLLQQSRIRSYIVGHVL